MRPVNELEEPPASVEHIFKKIQNKIEINDKVI